MTMKVIEYIHRPNKTEVGVGTNTNDSYLKLAPPIESSPIFTMNEEETFYNKEYKKSCLFKAVKYKSGGKEYRLTKLGAVKAAIPIECGDEMVFRRIIEGDSSILQLDIYHYKKSMAYSASKGKYNFVYPERLPEWNKDTGTAFPAKYKGKVCMVKIDFLENKHKRSDSPDETALYGLSINGNAYKGSTLYINLEGDLPLLEEKCKWELHDYTIEKA